MMISTTQPTLRQATVTGLNGHSLLPGDVPPSENISIFYDDSQPGDLITWRWRTGVALADYVQVVQVIDTGVQRLTVPLRIVYAGAGLAATLDYTVLRGGQVMEAYPTEFVIVGASQFEPRITQVVDATGTPVANGDLTDSTALSLSGVAMPSGRLELRHQYGVLATLAAEPDGTWRWALTGLEIDTQAFLVRGLYGAGPLSDVWVVRLRGGGVGPRP